jgi:hypothetical protein
MEDRALFGARETVMKYRPFCIVEMGKTNSNSVLAFFNEQAYVRLEDQGGDAVFVPMEYESRIQLN